MKDCCFCKKKPEDRNFQIYFTYYSLIDRLAIYSYLFKALIFLWKIDASVKKDNTLLILRIKCCLQYFFTSERWNF